VTEYAEAPGAARLPVPKIGSSGIPDTQCKGLSLAYAGANVSVLLSWEPCLIRSLRLRDPKTAKFGDAVAGNPPSKTGLPMPRLHPPNLRQSLNSPKSSSGSGRLSKPTLESIPGMERVEIILARSSR